MFDKIEKTRSAAAEEGWTNKFILHSFDQCGRSFACLFHVSTVGETSSAAAKYLIQVLIDQNSERENIILLCAPIILRCGDTPLLF